MTKDPLKRFSDRVEDYSKYRPGYPAEVCTFLRQECKLRKGNFIADIGAGTGIFSRVLLDNGFTVYAVEPNDVMRKAAAEELEAYKTLQLCNGTAEETGLPDGQMHLVCAAQSFHWFDLASCRAEFCRILRPGAYVCLLWNDRVLTGDPFHEAYEALLTRHGSDYDQVNHQQLDNQIFDLFFGKGKWQRKRFSNEQVLNLNGFTGRMRSSSYLPNRNDPGYEPMVNEAWNLFNKFEQNGVISIRYHCTLYYGKLS